MYVAGHNSRKLWADITSAIKTVYLQKEAALIAATNKYTSSRSVPLLVKISSVVMHYTCLCTVVFILFYFIFIFFFRNFFEMVRFDFALDEDLNVYLMEVRELFVHECAT